MLTRFDSEAAWLEARRARVTAGDVAAACGLDPYKSTFALWAEKTGRVEPTVADAARSEAMRWGNILEPEVAKRFAAETGRTLIDHGRHTLWTNDDLPQLGATLDREIAPIAGDPTPGVLETKTAGYLMRDRWEVGAPDNYLLQVQAQLAVTGYRWGAIAALIGGQDYRSFTVERDDALIALIVDRVDQFMRHVRDGIPPPADGSESTRAVLKKLYPEDSGATVDLGPEYYDVAVEFEHAKSQIKHWEAEKERLDAQLRLAIGHASFARIPGGARYSLKTTKRGRVVIEPTTYRTLLPMKGNPR